MSDPFTALNTAVIHGDSAVRKPGSDIGPPLQVTTIREYPPSSEIKTDGPERYVSYYSRDGSDNVARVEAVLSKLLDGHSVAYSNGVSAFLAIILFLHPKQVFISGGYFGIHQVLEITKRFGVEVRAHSEIASLAKPGDLVHLESPVNPTATARDIAEFARRAHDAGALLSLDATFAPPPLMAPFEFGVDIIMYSATKFLGGHSDILAGVLVTKDAKMATDLREDRVHLGSVIPPLEAWLLLRSLKTYPMRIKAQVENAAKIVHYLAENKEKLPKLAKVHSAFLQDEPFVKEQLPQGGCAAFAIETVDEESARTLPDRLKLFTHTTSFGGVESLIEWRAISNPAAPKTLLRVSVGMESADELINDLVLALQ